MLRVAVFLLIAVAIFAPFNFVAIRNLLRLHPRRKRWIVGAAVIGNLMWPFFPMLRSFTPSARLARALFGPPWFAWTSFAILYSALIVILAITRLPFRRRMGFAAFARWPSRIFLWLTIVGSVIGFYHATVPLRVEHMPVYLDALPAEAEGMRIAILADIHVGLFTRPSRVRTFFERTNSAAPDVVLLLGDMIDDDPHFVPKLLEATRALDPSTPLLAVLGNHEIYGDPARVVQLLNGSRIRLIVNGGAAIGPLWLAGVSDYAAERQDFGSPAFVPDMARSLAGRPAGALPILFAHQPKAFTEARTRRLPLTLAAHTHGGQCGFRPLGWSLAGVFLPYHMGLYRRGHSQLYVNTGAGFWLVPFRLGMTPEITIIELRRQRP